MKIMKQLFTLLAAIFSAMTVFSAAAYADIGPKPSLSITVKNMPNEAYYLDLLVQYGGEYRENASELSAYDADMLKLLRSEEKNGWYPMLTNGVNPLLFGSLTSENNVHFFTYFGVPDTYRIIIVTQSGKISISDIINRDRLEDAVLFDFETGNVENLGWLFRQPNGFVLFIIQFLVTFSLTIIIELTVFSLFRFKLYKTGNFHIIILSNLSTKLILNFTLAINSYFDTIILYALLEAAIALGEALIYRRFITGRTKARAFVYGVTANFCSFFFGFIILGVCDHLFG